MKKHTFLTLFILLHLGATAQLRLPALFASDMVLQQNAEVEIWGWAIPSETVKLVGSWNGDTVTVKTGRNARWKATLTTSSAGGPYTLAILASDQITLENVMLGEVWLCSGQSNMEASATHSYYYQNKEEEVANANYPNIRLFQVEKSTADHPQNDLTASWEVCTPESIQIFSGTAYFFGRKLHQDLNIPIGLIHSSWGGTGAEVWTDPKIIEANPELKENAKKLALTDWWPMEPGSAYHAMIAPLIPFKLAGVIWYQGESNTAAPSTYATLFSSMIEDWRTKWNDEFPFYYVQIAPFPYGDSPTGAMIRDQQRRALSTPNTGMVVTSDIGDIKDIHPKNKQDVGLRLANWALANTYEQSNPFSGPLMKNVEFENGKAVVSFDYAENGLVVRGKKLTHFEIAGADLEFVKAVAKIKGNQVEVSSKKVKDPMYVRFAWDNIAEPNLFNSEGLPASTFTTADY